MGCGCRQLGQAAGLDPRRAETQRSWGRLGAGEKLGRILDSGEKGYQRTLYGVDFTFAMAGGKANSEAGEGPEDRPGWGAGARGFTAAEPLG